MWLHGNRRAQVSVWQTPQTPNQRQRFRLRGLWGWAANWFKCCCFSVAASDQKLRALQSCYLWTPECGESNQYAAGFTYLSQLGKHVSALAAAGWWVTPRPPTRTDWSPPESSLEVRIKAQHLEGELDFCRLYNYRCYATVLASSFARWVRHSKLSEEEHVRGFWLWFDPLLPVKSGEFMRKMLKESLKQTKTIKKYK